MKAIFLRSQLRSYFKRTFRALNHRAYRLFFIGQSISLVGVWMQELAMSWLIYRLTGSATLLATVVFVQNFPLLLIGPYSGVLADRFSKRKILIITQSIATACLALISFLAFTDLITVPMILTIATVIGISSAIDMPCRQSFVRELVGKDQDIGNAVALNSMVFHLARLLGPSLGGVVVAYFSEAWCFLYTSISLFICVLIITKIVPLRESCLVEKEVKALDAFKEGLSFVKAHKSMKYMLYFVVFVSIFGMVSNVLIPVYVKDYLFGDSRGLGLLMGMSGLGSLLSAFFLASKNTVSYRIGFVCSLVFVGGLGHIATVLTNSLFFASFVVMITGFCFTLFLATTNTSLQILSGKRMNGRVMSLYVMAFKGTVPFGALLAGFWAQNLGIAPAFIISGSGCLLVAVWFYSKMNKLGMKKSSTIDHSYEELESLEMEQVYKNIENDSQRSVSI